MKIHKFSKKQGEIFKFIGEQQSALICDGAVRSGKTVSMILAFVIWAMGNFERCNFGICGKTVSNAERNIIRPLQEIEGLPYRLDYRRSKWMLTVRCGNVENYFYLFGGRDESSYALIQGITLAGVLLDEVALMPRSFVEQAIARTLTFPNRKLWFNCNPDAPSHWFFKEWIQNAKKRNLKHLHFLMTDNPILSQKEIDEAKDVYSGVFYDRYILGLWVTADGAIYPMYSGAVVKTEDRRYERYVLSMDYGTQNASAIGLWGLFGGVWYCVKEYYYSGRDSRKPKTDDEYYQDLVSFVGDVTVRKIIIDPSAASFIALLKQKGRFHVQPAENEVVAGILQTASAMKNGKIKINDCCKKGIEEIQGYCWDEKSTEDRPVKVNDHFCDMMRYFVYTEIYNKKEVRWG